MIVPTCKREACPSPEIEGGSGETLPMAGVGVWVLDPPQLAGAVGAGQEGVYRNNVPVAVDGPE